MLITLITFFLQNNLPAGIDIILPVFQKKGLQLGYCFDLKIIKKNYMMCIQNVE